MSLISLALLLAAECDVVADKESLLQMHEGVPPGFEWQQSGDQQLLHVHQRRLCVTNINPFLDDTSPRDHSIVDEVSCIGCKNCANVAPNVFRIEEDFVRAGVLCQSGNLNLVEQAIESCPVDCIHWTSVA